MKRKMTSVIAICTGLGLAGPAMADCQAELAELTGGTGMDSGGGIAKDGSMAPLEGADSSGSDTMTESGSTDMADSGSGDMAGSGSGSSGSDDQIAKDGSLAPLENADGGAADTSGSGSTDMADGSSGDMAGSGSSDMSDSSSTETADSGSGTGDGDNQIVKDGDTAPLEADTDSIATSGQDASEQQDGSSGDTSQEFEDAIATAQAALDAGDEAACMEAVEEARSL